MNEFEGNTTAANELRDLYRDVLLRDISYEDLQNILASSTNLTHEYADE